MAAGCVVRVRPADSTAFEKIFASGPIQKSRTFPNHLDTYTATPGPAQLPFMHRRTGKKAQRQCRDRFETQEKDRDEAAVFWGQHRLSHEGAVPDFSVFYISGH